MRSDKEMIEKIYNIADELEVVKAIAMNGSRVYKKSEDDKFQDFDIVYFVPDNEMKNLIDNHKWIDKFGERLILQTPMDLNPKPIDYTKRFNFLMLFKDENRLDLGIVPLSQIDVWAKKDSVAKVLKDPNGILNGLDLKENDHKYYRRKPTQGAFMRHTNEFWWTIPYVVKGILRNQFLYAADHYYDNVLGEFLVIIEWETAGNNNFEVNLGKNLSNLFNYLENDDIQKIKQFTDFSDYKKMTKNLFDMMNIFNEKSKAFAKKFNYEYNELEAKNIISYTNEKLNEFK